MATQITFNSVSLQDSNIVTRQMSHESGDNRDVNYQSLGRDGAKVVDDKFDIKRISVRGIIKDTTKATLDARIDAFKKSLQGVLDKDLDVAYSGGTRRYIATCVSVNITRDYYNITLVEFEANFLIGKPFGKDIDTTTGEFSGLTTGTQDSLYFYGSARPLPKIKMTVASETNWERIDFKNLTTGDTITVRKGLVAGDILIVDTDLLKVTLNGEELDYDGVFPQFDQGWNDFYTWVDADAYNFDLKLIYYKLWI